jgi:hypothetical protein
MKQPQIKAIQIGSKISPPLSAIQQVGALSYPLDIRTVLALPD